MNIIGAIAEAFIAFVLIAFLRRIGLKVIVIAIVGVFAFLGLVLFAALQPF